MTIQPPPAHVPGVLQQGQGVYTWFLSRFRGTQYPTRNSYVGEWHQGRRHGSGKFFYARYAGQGIARCPARLRGVLPNACLRFRLIPAARACFRSWLVPTRSARDNLSLSGAVYDGDWQQDLKVGHGVYTFENGCVYDGPFEADGMMAEVDPQAYEQFSFSLTDLIPPEASQATRAHETNRLRHVVFRHVSELLEVYSFYSALGCTSPDNTFLMTRLQLHRLLKDSRLAELGLTACEADRVIEGLCEDWGRHDPSDNFLPRQFIDAVIRVAHHLFAAKHADSKCVIADTLSTLLVDYILPQAKASSDRVGGEFSHGRGLSIYFMMLDLGSR